MTLQIRVILADI